LLQHAVGGATAGLAVPIYYDPLVSKLIAWAEDRPAAIARMRRALDEYVIAGIRTTIPFFSWLLAQREFLGGGFHTTYLDEVLAGRNGRPFVEAEEEVQNLAAVAAALQVVLTPESTGPGSDGRSGEGDQRWRALARSEGLR